MIRTLLAALFFATLVVGSCVALRYRAAGVQEPFDDEIVICGRLSHTGAPVVRWHDPGGYDAYQEHGFGDSARLLPTQPARECDTPQRYGVRAFLTDAQGRVSAMSPARIRRLVREHVDLIVLHYDAAGTSRRCFEVLHNERGLSAHFLIDVDGTIYQTLDVRERARHAGTANDRSVGIEIANVGAYDDLRTLYARRSRLDDGYGVRRNEAIASGPDSEPVAGYVQGRHVYQFPFTDAQYDSLIKLTRALHAALPRIAPAVPRTRLGDIPNAVLSPEQFDCFNGILGHYHVSEQKIDPGPAFDWRRLLRGLSRRAGMDLPVPPRNRSDA